MRNLKKHAIRLEIARHSVHMHMKRLVEFKKYKTGKNFVAGTDEVILGDILADLEDARERLGRLERKYL